MPDPLRTDTSRALGPVSEAERDAKIEQLLLAGLDHYFAARYEQAINVWTRALFFDRNHPRARAYIDRARSALAERQRESEELLQSGLAAFGRGDGDSARRLLLTAIDQGAPADEALAVLGRLDRLEQGQTEQDRRSRPRARTASGPVGSDRAERSPHRRAIAAAALLGAVVICVVWLFSTGSLALPQSAPALQAAPPFVETAPELPRRGEMALDRAQELAATGRLHDALATLDRVRPTDPERAAADRLRADIQNQLIALAGVPSSPDRPTTGRSRQP